VTGTGNGEPLALTFRLCLVAALLAGCPGPRAVPGLPPASDTRAAVPAPSPVLAEADCASPRIRVQVTGVVRSGPEAGTVRLRLRNPDKTAAVPIGGAFADAPAEHGAISGVYLVDEAGQRKAFVLRDDRGQPQCSTGLAPIPPAGLVEAWGRYPAPAAGATRVTVQVPGLAAFRDLPIADPPGGTGSAGPSY
jgi:hypothetical protein